MINTYCEYLASIKALSIEQMQRIHEEMIGEIGSDAEALELYNELIGAATKYAMIRAEWFLMDREEKMERDSQRTSYHNMTIMHFNMLSRYLKAHGKEAAWRELLGDEEDDKNNRKVIGDFACYLVFCNSLNAR